MSDRLKSIQLSWSLDLKISDGGVDAFINNHDILKKVISNVNCTRYSRERVLKFAIKFLKIFSAKNKTNILIYRLQILLEKFNFRFILRRKLFEKI